MNLCSAEARMAGLSRQERRKENTPFVTHLLVIVVLAATANTCAAGELFTTENSALGVLCGTMLPMVQTVTLRY